MKYLLYFFFFLIVLYLSGYLYIQYSKNKITLEENNNIQNTERTNNENTDQNSNTSLVVTNPKNESIVSSPLALIGKVRGSWLFEASAPVVLVDWDGKIIGESYIQTSDNWMTADFVEFTGEISFETPEDIGDFSDTGTLIFQKANPSGLTENDDAIEIAVRFR